jgi:hypothetical protein
MGQRVNDSFYLPPSLKVLPITIVFATQSATNFSDINTVTTGTSVRKFHFMEILVYSTHVCMNRVPRFEKKVLPPSSDLLN